jgi:hypothetical protein
MKIMDLDAMVLVVLTSKIIKDAAMMVWEVSNSFFHSHCFAKEITS